jgi:HD-GYP domain-containing protein (c-di-GMP phosphodiesterase class II)
MLKRVPTDQIQLGMFIHKLEGSWFQHPFWKSKFLLTDEGMLETLTSSDVPSVMIDTDRGLDFLEKPPAHNSQPIARVFGGGRPNLVRSMVPAAGRAPISAAAAQSTTVAEFGKARQITQRAGKVVSRVFLKARLGKAFEATEVEPVIDEIYASVQRNLYAFNGLLRCQQDRDFVYRHALAVSALMISLARQMKLSPLDIREAGMAGLMMDIGIGQLPDKSIGSMVNLRQLSEEMLAQHVLLGFALLKASGGVPRRVLDVSLQHHERLDGTGYPNGLSGDNIGLFSRMAAICDEYDYLVSSDGERIGLDPGAAIRTLGETGGGLDPEIMCHFIEMLGIYPIGAFVALGSGRLAMVVDEDPEDHSMPIVRTFYSSDSGKRIKGETIALARCFGADEIVGVAELAGLDLPDLGDLRKSILTAYAKEAGV